MQEPLCLFSFPFFFITFSPSFPQVKLCALLPRYLPYLPNSFSTPSLCVNPSLFPVFPLMPFLLPCGEKTQLFSTTFWIISFLKGIWKKARFCFTKHLSQLDTHLRDHFQWSCMDVRVGLWRKLSAEELTLLNCDVGEDSWESLGLQGDPTSPF